MTSWFRRWLGREPQAPVPASPDEPSAIDDMRDQIRRDVAAGYLDEDTILRNALDVVDGDLHPATVRLDAQRALRDALAQHALAERSWLGETDCERLDSAFAALEADGIVSRQNFTCCGNCGSAEIWDEIGEADKAGQPSRGYAFFHMQDTERAIDGGGLYLNYGACAEGEAAGLAIGHDIVARLSAHGLQTDWDGTLAKRIAVSLDWKRRRAASAA